MKKYISLFLSVLLVISMVLSFSSCSKSSNEMTEENIKATVDIVQTALKEFDQDTLNKYVRSKTLDYILKLSEGHDQYANLGKSIFENMEITIDEVSVENVYVKLTVTNKDLHQPASTFANKLLSKYSTFQLLNKLNDDKFLDDSLSELVSMIEAVNETQTQTVCLTVKQGEKNLVLNFDEEAENAVSGGALSAITNLGQ